MTDNDIDIAIRKQLLFQLKEVGIDIPVKAGFQSTKQGREDNMVMFFPINENGHGWQGRNYNIQGNNANHQENQLSEKTYQVQALITTLGNCTAGDMTAIVRMIVNSLPFVTALRKQNIGVQRATGIRRPYFLNDQGNYEQNPSFDFNVTFTRSLFPDTAAVSALYPDIHRI
ncbi:phage gateway protein [Providencia huaxiensis]|uniref:phage gateway protein n=1 Tax=Providencia huaxiensis TaxID=2027290 RepID=UPI003D281D41